MPRSSGVCGGGRGLDRRDPRPAPVVVPAVPAVRDQRLPLTFRDRRVEREGAFRADPHLIHRPDCRTTSSIMPRSPEPMPLPPAPCSRGAHAGALGCREGAFGGFGLLTERRVARRRFCVSAGDDGLRSLLAGPEHLRRDGAGDGESRKDRPCESESGRCADPSGNRVGYEPSQVGQ